ncbi:VPLPA-CTERM sorting domain-containing protein [Roseobacter insulae]|uniref:VPLPA-CTERM sorting domain-containing protein n=1 Tax=Roseobacter insulae TaxID=2859783 RepID=UPI0021514420|nr:VPLPA-CTERM sorting domain-containing protein [Roseobacter insulae]
MNWILRVCTAGVLALGVSTDAEAAVVDGVCNLGDTRITVGYVAANDANHVECSAGNPSYNTGKRFFFDMEYQLSYKSDGSDKADSYVTFSNSLLDNNAADNDWSLNVPALVESVILLFKQSNGYAAFLVSGTSGTWDISKYNKNGCDKLGCYETKNDYSHVDIWYKLGDATPVPLPAAGWMLLAGLGGLGAMRRLRKS